MDDDNTPGGTTEPNATPEPPKEPDVAQNPRMLAMDAIDEARMQALAQEGVIQAPAPAAAPAADDQLAAQLGDDNKPLAGGLEKLTVKVKVDGVESEVTVEELQRGYQKAMAADKRFQDAARERAEAERLLQEAQKLATPVATGEKPEQNSPVGAGDTAAEARNFVSALFGGDEDMAVDALVKLGVVGRKEPTLDFQQIAAQITPQVRQQLLDESALESFAAGNEFIVSDPYLAQMADGHLAAAQAEGKTFVEALDVAATKTRDWCRSKGIAIPDPKPNPTMNRQEKLERKSRISNVTGLNAKSMTNDEPVQTTQDILLEMRRARGLAV